MANLAMSATTVDVHNHHIRHEYTFSSLNTHATSYQILGIKVYTYTLLCTPAYTVPTPQLYNMCYTSARAAGAVACTASGLLPHITNTNQQHTRHHRPTPGSLSAFASLLAFRASAVICV